MNIDDKLDQAARQLATEVAPQRDLWPDIEKAITEPRPQRSRWTPMFAQAAAVVLLVGASSGLTWLALKDDRPVVVEFVVDPEENVFPMIPAGGSNDEVIVGNGQTVVSPPSEIPGV